MVWFVTLARDTSSWLGDSCIYGMINIFKVTSDFGCLHFGPLLDPFKGADILSVDALHFLVSQTGPQINNH